MRKPVRIISLCLFVVIVTAISIDFILAGIYVFAVTHPGCSIPETITRAVPPEEYWLTTLDGKSVRAWYYPSQNGSAVLALGGMGGALGTQLPPVDFLIQQGYGILQIDSRNCSQPPGLVTLGLSELYDASAGLAFLQERTEIARDSIAVFGFSMGGAAAIRLAARNSGIAAVINEGGYFNLGRDFVEPDEPTNIIRQFFLYTVAYFFGLEVRQSPWESSPIDDISKISPRPVMLIYGENEIVSGRAEQQFQAARQPKLLWVVPGGAHGTNYRLSKDEYEKRVLAFLDENLPH